MQFSGYIRILVHASDKRVMCRKLRHVAVAASVGWRGPGWPLDRKVTEHTDERMPGRGGQPGGILRGSGAGTGRGDGPPAARKRPKACEDTQEASRAGP